MKLNCKVVEDLLPLYLDEVCSEESRQLVEEHLRGCENCQKLIDSAHLPSVPYIEPEKDNSDQAIRHGFRKIRNRWILSVFLTIMVISVGFVGWNHWQWQPQQQFAVSFMEQLKQGNYEKAFSYIDTTAIKEKWLEDWFEEDELEDFDQRARMVFLQYAQGVEALGGITEYELIGTTSDATFAEGTSAGQMKFRIQVNGNARVCTVYAAKDGVIGFSTDGSFLTDPLAQFSSWREYLWQDYQGCYYDPDAGEYIYTNPGE